jgi:hypothetical protein
MQKTKISNFWKESNIHYLGQKMAGYIFFFGGELIPLHSEQY